MTRSATRLGDRLLHGLTLVAAVIISVWMGAIVLTVLANALPAIQAYGLGFLLGQTWNPVTAEYGILPMIYGTIVSSVLALILALVLGVGTGILLGEDFLPRSLRTWLSLAVELLAAIPSVVYGLWGIFVLIPLWQPLAQTLHSRLGWLPLFNSAPVGPGLLPAALVLTVMILPLIAAVTRSVFLALPSDWRRAARSVGATRWETIVHILLPQAQGGIWAGAMLALGRALGETMAVTMLIGNAHQLRTSLLAPSSAIAALLANQFAEAQAMQVAALMYAALVLFVITLGVNLLANWIVKDRGGEREDGRGRTEDRGRKREDGRQKTEDIL